MNKTDSLFSSHSPLVRMWRSDPFARFLWRLGLKPVHFALLAFVYAVIYMLVLPNFFGQFMSMLSDWPTVVILGIVLPLLYAFYYWQPSTIQTAYDGLMLRVPKKDFSADHVNEITRWFGRPIWLVVALIVSVLECVHVVNVLFSSPSFWLNAHPIMIAGLLPLRFLAFYSIVFIVVRQVIAIILINRLLKKYPVEITPLHPDRAGGLLSLGQYVLTIGIGVALIGLILGMIVFRAQLGIETLGIEFYVEIALYALAAPTLFTLPLWEAHRLLRQSRQQILDEIARELDEYYGLALDQMRKGSLTSREADQLKALEAMRELTEKAPTWPINVSMISRYSAAVVLPLLTPLGLDLFSNFVVNLFQR
jgi:hypothetical protein